jgi:MFS family permease
LNKDQGLFKNSFLRENIAVLAVSNAFANLGAGVIGVFMPEFFRRLGGNTIAFGLIGFLIFVIQFFTLLLGGFIADHYGRRKILVLTAFYGALFPLLYAVVQDWRFLAAVLVVAAIGSISSPASHAIIADSIPPEKRATGISALQVFSSLPLVVVPLVWGWLIDNLGWIEGFRIGCIYSILTALASAFIILFFLRETVGTQPKETLSSQNLNLWSSFSEVRRSLSTSLKGLLVAYCLIMFANAAVGQYYIIYATEVIKLTAFEWSIILSLQFLSAIVLKIPGSWVADKFGKKKVLVISALACAPFSILFTFSQSFIQVLIVMLLLVVAGIYYAPVHEALQADLTPRLVRGRIAMLWIMGGFLASAIGVFVGGLLFHTVSPETPFYLFTSAELVAVFLLVIVVKEPLKKEV